MEHILISIIIPLYNKEHTILNTISSILSQSYDFYEIIVVDDGSTDNSFEIVNNIGDSRVKIFTKKNGGVSSARNFGVSKAIGNWLLFFDADDVMMPYALEKFYEAICSYKEQKIFVSNFLNIDENGKISKSSERKHDCLFKNPIKALWFRDFYSRPGNTLIQRQIFKNVGGYDEELSYNEDYEFSLRLLSCYRVMFLAFNSMKYVKYAEGASMHVHALQKDFVCKCNSLAFDSIYKKLIIYGLLKFSLKQRHKDAKYIKKMIHLNYSYSFKFFYFICQVIRKVKQRF